MAVDLGDHLTFRLISSAPTGLGDNQPGVATRRLTFACFDIPDDCHRSYSATAEGVPTAEPYTAATAAELIARFVDPALRDSSRQGFWKPSELVWSAANGGSDG